MSLVEKLDHFAGAIGCAGANAPDEYADWSYVTYENNMAEIKETWAEIRPKLKRDLDKVELIETKLQEAFAAFENGEKEVGRDAMWVIYNLEPTKLR